MTATSKVFRVGLGEALRRLLDVEIRFRHGLTTPELTRERDMLLEALNRVEIQLGFDCDNDGVPDTIAIFKESSETSCCRIIDLPNVKKRQVQVLKKPEPEPPQAPETSRFEESTSRAPEPTKPAPESPQAPASPSAPNGIFGRMFGQPKKK